MKSFLTKIKMQCLLVLFVAGWTHTRATAQTLHALIVIQDAPDIGAPTDKTIFEAFLKEVATQGIRVNKKNYTNTQMTKTYLDNELAALSTSADDIIWFFYSGHGNNSGDGWPKTNGADLPESYVFNKLKTQASRLRITTYDCCNAGATVTAFRSQITVAKSASYRKLFLLSKGDVLMAGCKAENYSYGNISEGGIFTNALLKSIKTKNTWKEVLSTTTSETKASAQSKGETQEPIGNAENVQPIEGSTTPVNNPGDRVIINAPTYTNFTKTFPRGMTLEEFTRIVDKECTKQYKVTQKITVATLKRWNQNPSIPQMGDGRVYKINIGDFSTKEKTAKTQSTTPKGIKVSSVVKKVISNGK